ncbi:hypothetical protein M758_2G024000 [Ceratodon purpureus]|nr:hypothetical protein M758_2G024000 [Ceratodon purpureus]
MMEQLNGSEQTNSDLGSPVEWELGLGPPNPSGSDWVVTGRLFLPGGSEGSASAIRCGGLLQPWAALEGEISGSGQRGAGSAGRRGRCAWSFSGDCSRPAAPQGGLDCII